MSEETLFEFEAERTAHETATVLRELADGFEDGTTISFGDEVVVAAPSTMEVEIEVERDGPEGGPAEMEVELEVEWFVAGPEAGDETGEGDGSEAEEEAEEGDGSEAEEEAEEPGETDESEEGAGEGPPEDEAAEEVSTDLVEAAEVTSLARFQVYRDRAGEWRWRLVHRNGNIIATGGEGYASRQNARKGLRSVVANAPDAAVDDVDGSTD